MTCTTYMVEVDQNSQWPELSGKELGTTLPAKTKSALNSDTPMMRLFKYNYI